MKIAQIPPLIESVPPKGYGGTERIVSFITEELVRRGHDVTLFATADSDTAAKLVPVTSMGLRQMEGKTDALAWHFIQIDEVLRHSREFDILHFHNDFLHFPLSRLMSYAHVTTLHGRQDINGLTPLYKRYSDMPIVSISDDQRRAIPFANWKETVYHGLPLSMYNPGAGEGNYLAFLGRISVEKRPDRAIEIAMRAGIPLKIAAKIDSADAEYYASIRYLFDHPLIEFVGEIGEKEKEEFLGNAMALLFPIDWPEPFGLVMIEAMACGTPVIAWNAGSVPEIIDEGITGYVVSSMGEAVQAVNDVRYLEREQCRRKFEERFDAAVMVDNYEKVYEKIISDKMNNPEKSYSERMN
jgi:glycosyltransferase involved in cell wall biosynthesis